MRCTTRALSLTAQMMDLTATAVMLTQYADLTGMAKSLYFSDLGLCSKLLILRSCPMSAHRAHVGSFCGEEVVFLYLVPCRIVVKVMLGVYMMLAAVLMLNLLIAVFSHTYENLNVQSDKLWKWQR